MTQGYAKEGAMNAVNFDGMCRMASGFQTITAGGGDQTIEPGFDWTGGRLIVHISRTEASYFTTSDAYAHIKETSYNALTNATYTSGETCSKVMRVSEGKSLFAESAGSVVETGAPKSATDTSFTVHDNGVNTAYIKWFIWSPYTATVLCSDAGEVAGYDTEGAYRWMNLDGTKTKIYTKYLTGTTDNDDRTDVSHGVADYSKVTHCSAMILDSGGIYRVYSNLAAANASYAYDLILESSTVRLGAVGSALRSKAYNIKIDYYL